MNLTSNACDCSCVVEEYSPIFIQLLDCIYQLLIQFNNYFEYNNQLLILLGNY